VVPGGGGLEWLPVLVGHSRELEIILGSEDFDTSTAELYGYIIRAVPAADLDIFTDSFARRIATFDRFPINSLKKVVNQRAGLPSYADIQESQDVFLECTKTTETKQRLKHLFAAGLQQGSETERTLGQALALIPSHKI
jgi:enoyl-CoA hydratase/carnithine racemase